MHHIDQVLHLCIVLTPFSYDSLFSPFQYVFSAPSPHAPSSNLAQPNSCVGKQFAYQEMRLFISAILLRYDMCFRPGFDSYAWAKSVEDNGTLLENHKPLEVIFTRRKV